MYIDVYILCIYLFLLFYLFTKSISSLFFYIHNRYIYIIHIYTSVHLFFNTIQLINKTYILYIIYTIIIYNISFKCSTTTQSST